MSSMGRNAVDTRTMSLVFDNSRFDTPARNSLSLIERLKGALEASTHIKLFDDINRGVQSVTMEPLADAIDKIHVKMSALDTITDQWTRNFANSVERLAKSITVDQLTEGWSKYEDKTQAVQTIMAATADQWADQGRQMNYVNSQLEKMNWFTDETSYDFVDMTSNVGKFINAGVKLEDSVTAMEGIATWAARSGANVQEASRAMYNISQAMGSGKMQLTDWRSIELANMATMEFKRTVLKTAKDLGTLKEVSDGVYETLDGKATVTAETIRDELKKGWFTSEVIVETLKKYGEFTDALNRSIKTLGNNVGASQMLTWIKQFKTGTFDAAAAAEEAGVSVDLLTREVEELSDASYDFGREAFQAAQEAKTFTDAINYTKDAASSAWMNIYESLFGNYLEQKGLWTELAEHMYEAFIKPVEEIGDNIEGAFEKEAIIGEREWNLLKENGIVSDEFIGEIIKAGKKFGYITDDMTVDAQNFVSTLEDGWFTADLFDKIFKYNGKGMAHFSDTVENGITDVRDLLKLAEVLRHDEVYGGDPDHWTIDYKQLGYNQDAYHTFVESVSKDYNKLKETEGESATITDEMLTDAAAAVLSLQYGHQVTADEVEGIIAELDKESTAYDKAARKAEGLAKVAVDRNGNESVARMESSYYWSESLAGSMDILTKLVELFGERAAEVFGTPGEGDIQDFAVDVYNLVNRVLDLIENSETLRTILDTLFSIVKIKASVAVAKFIILRDTAKGLVNVITSFAEGLTGKKKTIGEVAKMLGDAAAKFAAWLNDSQFIANAFDIIASIAGVAGMGIRAFIDTFIGLDKVSDTTEGVKKGIVGTFGDIGRFISGLAEKFREFKDKVKSLDDLTLDDLKTTFEETVGAFVGDFDGFTDIKDAFTNLKTWVKDTLKGVGIDTDSIIATLKSVFGLGEDARDVWVDGIGWYHYDPKEHTFLYKVFQALEGTYKEVKEFVTGKADDLLASIFGTPEYRQKIMSGEIDITSEDTLLGKILIALQSAYGAVKEFLTNQIIAPLQGAWDNVIAFFKGEDIDLSTSDDTFLGRVFAMLQKGFEDVAEFFAEGGALEFGSWAGSALEKALYFVQDLINGFINWASGIHWMKLTMTMLNIRMAIDAIGGIKGIRDIIEVIGDSFELLTEPFTKLRELISEFKRMQFAKNLLLIAISLGIMVQALYTICEKIDENHLLNGIMTLGILGLFLVALSEAISVFDLAGMPGASLGQTSPLVFVAWAVKMLSEVLDAITTMVKESGGNVAWAIVAIGALEGLLLAFSELMSFFSEKKGMPGAGWGQVLPLLAVAYSIKMMASILKSVTELVTKEGANVVGAIATIGALEGLLLAFSELMSFFSSKKSMNGATWGQVTPLLAVAFTLKVMGDVLKAVTELVQAEGWNVGAGLAVIGGLEALLVAMSEVMSFFSSKKDMGGAKLGQVAPLLLVAWTLSIMADVLKAVANLISVEGWNVGAGLAVIGGLEALILAMSEVMSLFSKKGMVGAKLGQVAPLLMVAVTLKIMSGILKAVTNLVSTGLANTWAAIGVIGALEGLLVAMSELMSFLDKKKGLTGSGMGQMLPLLVIGWAVKILVGSVKAVSKIDDIGKVWNAVGVVAVLGALLVGLTEIMSAFNVLKKMPGGSFGQMVPLIVLAFAIRALGNIVKAIAKVDDQGKIWSAVGAVAVLGILLIGLNTVLGSAGLITTGWDITGLVFAAGCVLLLAHAVGELARLDTDKLWTATLALSIVTVVFTICANFMPVAQVASAGLFAMIGVVAVLAVVIGALSKLGGEKLMDAALALAVGMGTLLIAGYAMAGLGALAMPILAGVAVLLGLILLTGLIGILAANCEDLKEKMDAAKEWLGSVGEALGAFFGGFLGGAVEEYTKHLPQIGRFLKDFTRITSQIKEDEFNAGIEKLRKMGEILAGITWDTLWGGIANMMGKVEEYDDQGNVTKEVNIWEQFVERAETIASALTAFQEEIDKIAEIDIPLEEVEALSQAIMSLPFEKGGFLSWFTGKSVAGEEDVDAFKTVGTKIAEAITSFNTELPRDLDTEKVLAASEAVMAISTLGRLISELMGGDLNSLFVDRKLPEAFELIGGALESLSSKEYNLDNLGWITNSTDAITGLVTSVAQIKLPKGDISNSDQVTTVVGNIVSLVGTVLEYSDTKFDGASRIKEMCDKLNTIMLNGDISDETKVQTFTESVRNISDAFEEVASAYVDTTSGSSFSVNGFDVSGLSDEVIGTLKDELDPEKLKSQVYSDMGIDESGGGNLFTNILGELLGVGSDGKIEGLDSITGLLTDENGDDILGLGSMIGDIKEDLTSLKDDFSADGMLGEMFSTFKEDFSGENGMTSSVADLTQALGTLGSEDGEAMKGLDAIIEKTTLLRSLLGMDSPDGQLTVTPVVDSEEYSAQLSSLSSDTAEAFSIPGLSGLIQANIDLSPLETAISGLDASNKAELGRVQDLLGQVSNEIGYLAGAINRINVILDTGVLVGEITPQINESLGLAYGR